MEKLGSQKQGQDNPPPLRTSSGAHICFVETQQLIPGIFKDRDGHSVQGLAMVWRPLSSWRPSWCFGCVILSRCHHRRGESLACGLAPSPIEMDAPLMTSKSPEEPWWESSPGVSVSSAPSPCSWGVFWPICIILFPGDSAATMVGFAPPEPSLGR